MMKIFRRLAIVAFLAVLCCSCSFMNRQNRPLMNLYEKHVFRESVTAQVLTAPVVLPGYLLAGAADVLIMHPADVVDDAWLDTEDALWQPLSGRGYVTECALFPVRALLTPVICVAQFGIRSAFDVSPWPPSLDALEKRLRSEDHEVRMAAAMALNRSGYKGADAARATHAMIKACQSFANDALFRAAVMERLPGPLTNEARDYLADVVRAEQGSLCGAAIKRLFIDCLGPGRAYKGSADPRQAMNAVDHLALVYDEIVQAQNHVAEVYLATLAGRSVRLPGPRALGLYIVRSLAAREWPDYAEAASFMVQSNLLATSAAAQVDAIEFEWRALRLSPSWLIEVRKALRLQEQGAASRKPALIRQQNAVSEQLKKARHGRASELFELAEQLMAIKTMLDADEVAGRLLKAPESDRRLFLDTVKELCGERDEP